MIFKLKNTNHWKIEQNISSSNHSQIGLTLNSLANYYKAIENDSKAHDDYLKAFQCQIDPCDKAKTRLYFVPIDIINRDYSGSIQL